MPDMPDPVAVAKSQFDVIKQDHEYHPDRGIERVLADAPWCDRDDLIAGLEDFHKERMAKVPSETEYPEALPWVDHVLAVDREFQRMTGYTDAQMALKRSLNDYLRFRGFLRTRVATTERCRCAYLPESDRGQIHIKNVDDPITHFKPRPPATGMPYAESEICMDGVGSGLHIDDEPDELFPLPVDSIWRQHANDVDGVVEVLQKYSKFWGGANRIFHDWKGNSVAVEKCSYNFMEVFRPGPDGRSHCSGMTCRDPQSPQGKYQRAKRDQYVERFKMGADCADNAFWATCAKFEKKLSDGLAAMGDNPTWQALADLFTGEWPNGLNKAGLKVHPNQGLVGYTLIIHASLYDENTYVRWQRNPDDASFPAEPEVYVFDK